MAENQETIVVKGERQGAIYNNQNFHDDINTGSIVKPSRYMIQLARPKGLSDDKYPIATFRRLSLRSNQASLPGIHFFESNNIKRTGAGASEQRPYQPSFNSFTISFILDVSMKIEEFFMDWAKLQVNFDRNNNVNPYYLLSYKDDFICPRMIVDVYNQRNERKYSVFINDLYIQTISDVNLSWSADNVAELNVTFQYKDFTIQKRD